MQFVILALFALQFDYCNIQRAHEQTDTPTVYIFISCILMPQICIKSGGSCQMYPIFTMFPSSQVPFQIK